MSSALSVIINQPQRFGLLTSVVLHRLDGVPKIGLLGPVIAVTETKKGLSPILVEALASLSYSLHRISAIEDLVAEDR